MRTVAGLLAALALLPGLLDAQATGPARSVRVLEVRTEPDRPVFGEVFRVRVTVHASRAAGVSLADTLASSYALRSAAPGTIEVEEIPGDSVEIRASYPVLPMRDGVDELPGLLVRFGADTEEASAGGEDALAGWVPLGRVDVLPMAELAEGEEVLSPRPPADVSGGEWSPWALLAAGVLVLGALATGTVAVAARRGERVGSPAPDEGAGAGPLSREEALARLEEIRAAGGHRNGAVVDFYRASTDTLRRFVEGASDDWTPALTSRELLERARGRWGEEAVGGVRPAVLAAEGVKFGGRRPGPDAAEADWKRIRDWVRDAPEAP